MTTSTYAVPQSAELSAAPVAGVRRRVERTWREWRERRALERAAELAGPAEWARMSGDLLRG